MKAADWERLEKTYISFTELLLSGEGIPAILTALNKSTGLASLYQDLDAGVWYYWNRSGTDRERRPETYLGFLSQKSYSVQMNGKLTGRLLLLLNEEPGEYEEHVIAWTIRMLKLWIQKKQSNREIEERHRDAFVQDLVLNNIRSYEEVLRRGQIYGWNLNDRVYSVMIVDIDDFKIQYEKVQSLEESARIEQVNKNIFQNAETMIRQSFPEAMTTKFIDVMGVILPHPVNEGKEDGPDLSETEKKLTELAERLRRTIKDRFRFSLTVAISTPCEGIMDAHLAYEEAKKCVKISRILYRRDKVIRYSELGIYRFLYSIRGNEEAEGFYQEYINILLAYDKEHRADLMETLIKIILSGWSLKEAAEEMFLHYNTIKYRYRKIGELLNLDLENTGEKLNLELAVKSYLLNHLDETAPEEYSW